MPGRSLAQDPGAWDVDDMGWKATISASIGPRLALFVGKDVPRAWTFAVSNTFPHVRLLERTTFLTVAFLAPTGLWYAIWKLVPVWSTEAFWTRSSWTSSHARALRFEAADSTCQGRRQAACLVR